MTKILHKISPKAKSIIAAALSLVMVFGIVAVISPIEAQAISVGATDAGFYNIAYGENGETTFGPGTQIRVISLTRQNKSKNDAVYLLDDKGWKPADPNKYVVWEGITNNTFYGVYPYNAEYESFKIPTDQAGGVQDADWMTDDFTGNKSMEKVEFTFQHRLAKVTVNITNWNNEFDGSNKVIEDPKIYTKGTDISVDHITGVYTSDGTLAGIDPYVDGTSYTAIVAPAAYNASDKFMTFKVGEQEMTVLATASQLTKGLEPGNHYTFDLTVGKDVVEITEVKVNGWNEENMNGGVAEAVEVSTVINGTTATLIIPELATDALVQEALKELNTDGITTINVDGLLNENRQKYIAEALEGKTVDLYLAQLTEDELIDELKNNDNITVTCGYYIADDSTFMVYSANGLLDWNDYTKTNPAANLSLQRNITLPLADGAESNWTSVGTEGTPYIGTVDGNGYSITGMTINQTTQDAGFIGYLGANGKVKNLTLKEVSVKNTAYYTGGFVGRAYHTTVIENCAVESGTITGNGGFIGGVVGCALGSNSSKQETLIIACSNKANVDGNYASGGILGGCLVTGGGYTKIIACYNSGYISGNDRWNGGITGDINNFSSSIRCCYNTGETNRSTGISGRNNSSGKSGHNYWSSRHNWANGTSIQGEYNNNAATKITDASQWENAMTTMNTWLAENGYEYRYVINTDAATKDAQPLIIVEVES